MYFLNKKHLLFLGVLCSFKLAYAFDLSDAYQHAITYNAKYLASIAENQAKQEKKTQGLASLLPQFNAQISVSENPTDLYESGLFYSYNQPSGNITFSQVIFDFSKYSAYVKSKYETSAADLTLEDAQQNLMVLVANAYFDVLNATDILNADKAYEQVTAHSMIEYKKRFEVGMASIADYNDQKAEHDNIAATLISDQNDLVDKKNKFHNLTGLDTNLIQPTIQDINLVLPHLDSIDSWANYAKKDNISLKAGRLKLAMADEDISIAKAGHMPTIGVNASANYQGTSTLDGSNSQQAFNLGQSAMGSMNASYVQGSIALNLNVPLYSGGAVNSKVREAISSYEQASKLLLEQERSLDQQVKLAYLQVYNGVDLIKAKKQALDSAKIQVKSTTLGYEVGKRTSLDIVTAQNKYYAVVKGYASERYNYLKAILNLNYLAGRINKEVINYVNANIQQ
ncbi:MAG: hypothetical protein E6Q89_01955 [Bacteroidia bacterium]|nr:MAG: hypothetical protein E6Q89_01955 [Bacteroidia bacterium]